MFKTNGEQIIDITNKKLYTTYTSKYFYKKIQGILQAIFCNKYGGFVKITV